MLDAHVHLWHYQPAAFPWIGAGMDVLKRDYLLADLKAATRRPGVDAGDAGAGAADRRGDALAPRRWPTRTR